MAKTKYHMPIKNKKKSARAVLKNQPASLKYSTEVCREIRGKNVEKALGMLNRIVSGEEYLPLRKYKKKVAHRKGRALSGTKSGRRPVRTINKFIELLKLVKANADYKGLDSENLIIKDAFASSGFSRTSHQAGGRISGKMYKRKSTHMEVLVVEGKK